MSVPLPQWILYLACAIRKENVEALPTVVGSYFSITLMYLGRRDKESRQVTAVFSPRLLHLCSEHPYAAWPVTPTNSVYLFI